jgi:hypothetical protein
MTTKTDLGWFERYKEASKERDQLQDSLEKLRDHFKKIADENSALLYQINIIRGVLK